jgi:transcriptional regulator with PAS, ATPase and Fis domain
VIAATHIHLESAISEKKFRPDLYYRINIFPIYLPPLRERKEDIPLLAHYFLQKHNRRLHHSVRGFSREVYQRFEAYEWPGNIRELESVIERSIISCQGDLIDSFDYPAHPPASGKKPSSFKNLPKDFEPMPRTLKEGTAAYKQRIIQKTLEMCNGNQRAAALKLGIAPSNFSRMIHQMKLNSK